MKSIEVRWVSQDHLRVTFLNPWAEFVFARGRTEPLSVGHYTELPSVAMGVRARTLALEEFGRQPCPGR